MHQSLFDGFHFSTIKVFWFLALVSQKLQILMKCDILNLWHYKPSTKSILDSLSIDQTQKNIFPEKTEQCGGRRRRKWGNNY